MHTQISVHPWYISNTYFTPWHTHLLHTIMRHITLSLSLIHTKMPSLAASVQFLNGPAVRVRLMVSQPPPSACISVHLSAQPFAPSSEQHAAGVVCMQFLTAAKPPTECSASQSQPDYVPDQNKSSSLPMLFEESTAKNWMHNVVPAGLAGYVWSLSLCLGY